MPALSGTTRPVAASFLPTAETAHACRRRTGEEVDGQGRRKKLRLIRRGVCMEGERHLHPGSRTHATSRGLQRLAGTAHRGGQLPLRGFGDRDEGNVSRWPGELSGTRMDPGVQAAPLGTDRARRST